VFQWLRTRVAALADGRRALGQSIELEAARWLEQRGLRIVQRNFCIVGGEIDLIAREQATLVFVEVRYRRDPGALRAIDSVGPRKRRLLLRCAQAWLAQHPADARRPCRFDVVGVEGERKALRFEWIRDAFSSAE
jgi:putative endonuclease